MTIPRFFRLPTLSISIAIGSEHRFASLVYLKTGDIVWFNVVNAGAGERRNKDSAAELPSGAMPC